MAFLVHGMNFLEPAAFAFLAAIPVVIVFYMLKRRRVAKLVSSTILWQRFLAETQASSPLQRLRNHWLMWLQLLILVLAVLALARPYFSGPSRGSRLRVLILDVSASMQARDELPSRFEKARQEALKWIDAIGDSDQMIVLQAGVNTEVRQSATGDKIALRRAVNACAATDSPTHLLEAFKLAETLIKNRSDAEIHLFSDGAVNDLEELEHHNLPVIYHRVGQRCYNAGIVSIEVRANPENAAQRAIFAAVANFSTNTILTDVQLLFEGRAIETRPLELAPSNTVPIVFVAAQDRDGVFTVRLELADDLAVDNQASVVSLLPHSARVLLVTRGNRFLEKALKATPNIQLSLASTVPNEISGWDLMVLDDLTPAIPPRVNLLSIRGMNTNWFSRLGTVQNPPIVDWKTDHPVLRFVNFDNVQIAEALTVVQPSWGVTLVESPTTPLVVAGELERHRLIWCGFDPLQSTWPLRISFPIFVANAVEWLNPANANSSRFLVRAGEPFRWSPPESMTGNAMVIRPDGSSQILPIGPIGRELVFGETLKEGVYRLKSGTNEWTFCVNLLDANESNVLPREELPIGKYSKVTATTMKRASLELWRWIAAAALVVLLFEWWFYHRRTA